MHPRNISQKIQAALSDTPVVLLNGARQTGKSTLTQWLMEKGYPATYFNLDNVSTLATALNDPTHFTENLQGPTILDEIQRTPNLFLAIKEAVDKNRRAGQFLLTGSANVLLLPTLSDSLAGRMEIINLWPLSQGEIQGTKEFFIDALFSEKLTLPTHSRLTREELIQKIIFGGYPEVLTRQSEDRRYAWFDSYITTILQRDVRDIANIDGLMQLPRLLTLLATRASHLFNLAEISRISGIAQTTLSRYFAVLQTIFLIYTIPAYSNNLGKRLTKSSKLYFCDTGLSTHLLGITFSRLQHEPDLLGPLLENFVANELKKQLSWNKTHAELFHYRTTNGQEVDFILENKAGFAIGIEVKSSATLSEKDFKGLKHLSETLDDKLIRGILLYTGQQTLSFGKNLYAIPIGLLWEKN